jgi:hypothetical protein
VEHTVTGLLQRLRRGRRADESGFSLIELVVATGIFTIFISLFLVAVVSLARGTSRATLTADSSSGVLLVFQDIDRQVRYADAVNFPGNGVSGSRYRYVEFRTPAASARSGVTTCTQWRYDSVAGTIASRQWTDVGGAVASPWKVKLDAVYGAPSATYPFRLEPATANQAKRQRLYISIDAGNLALQAGASIETSFIARNSSISSPGNSNNGTQVCLSTIGRP